jgi:hypothetical protein
MDDLLPVRTAGFVSSALDRRTSRALDLLDAHASVARAKDRARAERAAQRTSDIRAVTNHAIAAAASVGCEMETAMSQAPLLKSAIAALALSGVAGMKQQIDQLADPMA